MRRDSVRTIGAAGPTAARLCGAVWSKRRRLADRARDRAVIGDGDGVAVLANGEAAAPPVAPGLPPLLPSPVDSVFHRKPRGSTRKRTQLSIAIQVLASYRIEKARRCWEVAPCID